MGLRRGSALLSCLLALFTLPAVTSTAAGRSAVAPAPPGTWTAGAQLPLAAPNSRLDSVSCVPGAEYCLTSGSHRGLVDEQHVEVWDGAAWSVAPPAPVPEASALRDARMQVDCLAVDFCVRGRDLWDGATWTPFAGDPDPRIVAIECASTTWCLGVGYAPEDEQDRWFVTGVWNGHSWSVTAAGGDDDRSTSWTDVECPGPGFCLATRAWTGLGGQVTSLVRWDGAAWVPVDAWSGDAVDLSCASATSCFVAGHRELPDSGEPPTPILRRWDGSTAPEVPLPVAGAASVSCWGGQRCLVVGEASADATPGLPGGQQAAVWNGRDWTRLPDGTLPEPPGGGSLGAVSCTSTGCVGVGRSTDPEAPGTSYSAVSDGYTWGLEPTANPPGARIDALTAISCAGGGCATLGRATARTGAADGFVGDLTGPWRARLPAGAAYADLACAGTGPRCVAVGHQRTSAGLRPVAWHGAAGPVLRRLPLPRQASSGTLSAVDCRGDDSCVAVGRWSGRAGRRAVTGPLVVVYDGTRWRLGAAPATPGIRDARLSGVACPRTNVCTMVGSGRVGGRTRGVVGTWRGASWRLAPAPGSARAASARLVAVDCGTATRCVAVGSARRGAVRPLVVSLSRSRWRAERTPAAAGELSSVTCPSATACRAVGGTGAGALSLSGRPGSWIADRVAATGPLSDVSCPDPTACVAVGGAGVVLRGNFAR